MKVQELFESKSSAEYDVEIKQLKDKTDKAYALYDKAETEASAKGEDNPELGQLYDSYWAMNLSWAAVIAAKKKAFPED
jgi:hypothetical protein